MNRQQQVFVRLKLKAKALGFNAKELKGIAAKIADNLKSAEDASEEDVNAEIDEHRHDRRRELLRTHRKTGRHVLLAL